ncbi:MAG TPA: hypothetical protein VJB98_01385 [Candidatus Paceibacterota bacterium]
MKKSVLPQIRAVGLFGTLKHAPKISNTSVSWYNSLQNGCWDTV